jgi:hypothetical protein
MIRENVGLLNCTSKRCLPLVGAELEFAWVATQEKKGRPAWLMSAILPQTEKRFLRRRRGQQRKPRALPSFSLTMSFSLPLKVEPILSTFVGLLLP